MPEWCSQNPSQTGVCGCYTMILSCLCNFLWMHIHPIGQYIVCYIAVAVPIRLQNETTHMHTWHFVNSAKYCQLKMNLQAQTTPQKLMKSSCGCAEGAQVHSVQDRSSLYLVCWTDSLTILHSSASLHVESASWNSTELQMLQGWRVIPIVKGCTLFTTLWVRK